MSPMPATSGPRPGPTNVLILSKIPEGISEQQIAAGVGSYSQVLQVSYRAKDLDGPGWAIIAFASPEIAKAAKERLDGKAFPGAVGAQATPLEVSLGEGLYGNIRGQTDQESMWKEARTPQGQVYYFHATTRQSVWVKPPMAFGPAPTDPKKTPASARSLVNPTAAAQGAIAAAQQTAFQAQQQTGPEPGQPINLNSGPVGANLFIYHIPNSWDDSILRQHFEHFGKIVSCRVQTDNEGRPRGFGFVSFDASDAAAAAIAGMHGFPVEGKHLKVQLKKGDEQLISPAPGAAMASMGAMLDFGSQVSAPQTILPPPSFQPAPPMPPPAANGYSPMGAVIQPPRGMPY